VSHAGVLRFATAGSVDDGKSTLIGRLLYDSKSIFEDQYSAIEVATKRRGEEGVNLALLTDGLRAEREQGITIDVAYRYFATPKRKFILADTPGHVQYTRNMVTGASTVDLTLLLIDARFGVVEQTRRHAFLAALLRVPRLVVCVNKMDLMGWDEAIFEKIKTDFLAFSAAASLEFLGGVDVVPISALSGDGVVTRSENLAWHDGPALLELLETAAIPAPSLLSRFPVQNVIRVHPDYRGYAGRVAGGSFSTGQKITVLPSGKSTQITSIETADGSKNSASSGESVTILLAEELDISRGDLICSHGDLICVGEAPRVTTEFSATLCWLSEKAYAPGRRYTLRHTTRETKAMITEIVSQIDVNTLENLAASSLAMNDIARVRLRSMDPLALDAYAKNRVTGSFLLIDDASGDTLAAGMID
jgi:sulfate adenylyltransferase large subunit